MIIRCPKCDFEQPHVEFCAKCGVNISKYHKKPKPFSERLKKNSFTYLVLLVICLFGTGLFIKSKWFSSSDKIPSLEPSQYSQLHAQQKRKAASIDSKQSFKMGDKLLSKESAPVENKNLANPYIVVRIIAIPTAMLSFYAERLLNNAALNTPSVLKVPTYAKEYLKQLDQMEHFYKTKYYANVFQKPLVIQQTMYSDQLEDELGFILNLSIDSYQQNDLLLRVHLNRNFLIDAEDDEPTWSKLDETLSFAKNDTYILYGILPQRIYTAEEIDFFSDGYLALVKEKAFQRDEITFAAIFTYKY